jgi:predicted O-methyltransferase YrrM
MPSPQSWGIVKLYSKLPSCERASTIYIKREGHGVELEVGAMLYALVRLMKPEVCIETGLFIGDSAVWIGKALQDNGRGHLHTCDVDINRIEPGRARLAGLPVTVHKMAGYQLLGEWQDKQIDFVHIDSGDPGVRQQELMMLDTHNLSPLGIVAWHDACRNPTGNYENMYEAFASARDWPHLVFPSLVGMAVFQRPE